MTKTELNASRNVFVARQRSRLRTVKRKSVSPDEKATLETILIAEGHPLLLKILKEILEDAHFTVLAANSAKKAIRIEAEFPGTIDLLLSDVMMPGVSGPDLAKKLKK